MKIADLRKKSVEELQALEAETRSEVRELRFAVALRQEGNVRKLRTKKRELSRILTLINEMSA